MRGKASHLTSREPTQKPLFEAQDLTNERVDLFSYRVLFARGRELAFDKFSEFLNHDAF